MAEVRVEPIGFEELARSIGGVRLAQVMEPPLVRGLERFRADLAHYPPPPPDSSYTRTGTLGRSWATRHELGAGRFDGETGTNVDYGPYVQDAERQAWMHRDRWNNTDENVADRHRGAILADFNQTTQEELNRAART